MKKNKENLEELKKIVSDIKQAIAIYNNLNPDNKLVLAEHYENSKDVSNIQICVYNKCHIGLFKQISYWTESSNDILKEYHAGLILSSIDSEYVGVIVTHRNTTAMYKAEKIGYRVSLNNGKNVYIANCEINDLMSFDDMRMIMKKAGKIDEYKIGKSNSIEMQKVLEYAFDYYQLDKKHKTKKLKK